MQALQKPRGSQSITSFSSYCSPPKIRSVSFALSAGRRIVIQITYNYQYNYTMQSASFSIPSPLKCNISMNAATLHRIICPPQPCSNRKICRTGNELANGAKRYLLLAAANHCRLHIGKQGGLEPLVCWENCPQAPLNDFAKSLRALQTFFYGASRKLRRYVNVSLTYSLFSVYLKQKGGDTALKIIGERLGSLRESVRLSQAKLAKEFDV